MLHVGVVEEPTMSIGQRSQQVEVNETLENLIKGPKNMKIEVIGSFKRTICFGSTFIKTIHKQYLR